MSAVVQVDAIPLATRLKRAFRFGTVVRTESSSVVLRLAGDDGNVGWGEACPVPQLTAETPASVIGLIEGDVRAALLGRRLERWRPLLSDLRTLLAANLFTLAAVDTAVLDLVGKIRGLSISDLLGGGYRTAVAVHGSVGWFEDPAEMAAAAVAQTEDVRALKLYVGPGELAEDLDRLRAVREAVGSDQQLLIDVNGMWSREEALAAAPVLRDLGVLLVEQPLSSEDAEGAAQVAEIYRDEYALAVVADESVRSAADVLRFGRCAHAINVGLSKLGGLTASLQVASIAEAMGIGVVLGSVVEQGIATAAGLHLAALLPRLDYPAYLLGPLEYVRQVTTPPLAPAGGLLAVPDGPGLGIDLDLDLEALASMDARNRDADATWAAEAAGSGRRDPGP